MFGRRPLGLVSLTAVGVALVTAPAAAALEPTEITGVADRLASAWAKRQHGNGFFNDYFTGRPTRGYGGIMLGDGLVRAGRRAGQPKLLRAGLRAAGTTLDKSPPLRGVFDLLSFASIYNEAEATLEDEERYLEVRSDWRRYLRTFGPPFVGEYAQRCVADPGCFSNHEVVDSAAALEALATGLRSSTPGARLRDRPGLRRLAQSVVGRTVRAAMGSGASSSGPGPRHRLGLLTDTGTFPLAYHSLSTAMLGLSLSRLGDAAPAAGRSVFRRALESLAAFMAPDGDVAYIGRRQEEPFALAGAVYAGSLGATMFRGDRAAAGRFETLARRALARLGATHRPPRPGFERTASGRGKDLSSIVSDGLIVFLLNRVDETAAPPDIDPRPLTSSRNGWFLDPAQSGFAAVRRGNVWFAVHAFGRVRDLRDDFGLIALKHRPPGGPWGDVMRLRPRTTRGRRSAGPVLLSQGRKWLPVGTSIRMRPRGQVVVKGGWRIGRKWLRRGVTFRFIPAGNGARMTFPIRRGELVRLTAFLSRRTGRLGRNPADDQARYSLSRTPDSASLRRGYASCCGSLIGVTVSHRARRGGRVAWTVRAR